MSFAEEQFGVFRKDLEKDYWMLRRDGITTLIAKIIGTALGVLVLFSIVSWAAAYQAVQSYLASAEHEKIAAEIKAKAGEVGKTVQAANKLVADATEDAKKLAKFDDALAKAWIRVISPIGNVPERQEAHHATAKYLGRKDGVHDFEVTFDIPLDEKCAVVVTCHPDVPDSEASPTMHHVAFATQIRDKRCRVLISPLSSGVLDHVGFSLVVFGK